MDCANQKPQKGHKKLQIAWVFLKKEEIWSFTEHFYLKPSYSACGGTWDVQVYHQQSKLSSLLSNWVRERDVNSGQFKNLSKLSPLVFNLIKVN